MNVLALIPARAGSKGVPNKNFRGFTPTGDSLVDLAIRCAAKAGHCAVVSSDAYVFPQARPVYTRDSDWIRRPVALAQDNTPMRDVVAGALVVADALIGKPYDAVVLLQPTSPLRTPAHIHAALDLLVDGVSSVVSVTRVPEVFSAAWQLEIDEFDGFLWRVWNLDGDPNYDVLCLDQLPANRQDLPVAYRRDGTVYVFRPEIIRDGRLYGDHPMPLIIPPAESLSIDTQADWDEAQRRWEQRES